MKTTMMKNNEACHELSDEATSVEKSILVFVKENLSEYCCGLSDTLLSSTTNIFRGGGRNN